MLKKFKNFLKKQHKNIKFTSEIEENNSLSFLDITISRKNNKFVTSVYRKAAVSGIFTNFESFVPDIYKNGLILKIKLCFIEVLDYAPITKTSSGRTIKSIFKHINYFLNFFNQCINKFLNKLFIKKRP